jgi:hypothetical protein
MRPGDRFFESRCWGVIALCEACAREMEREINSHVQSGEWKEISLEEAQELLRKQAGSDDAVLAFCDQCKGLLSHIPPIREIRFSEGGKT